MNNILKEYPKDNEVIMLVRSCIPMIAYRWKLILGANTVVQDLQILQNWKFQTRNKIETSKIEDQLKKFVDYEDDKIANMAEGVSAFAELESVDRGN